MRRWVSWSGNKSQVQGPQLADEFPNSKDQVNRVVASKVQLFREVGLLSATFLVVGNIVGIGIFTTSGLIAEELGSSFWLLGTWIIGGLLALIGAICYSHLGTRFPQAGGEFAFLYPSFGPLPAFLSGWASLFIGFSAPIAASALGLAYHLLPLLPEKLSGISPAWIAASALLAVTLLLSVGLGFGTQLHSLVTFFNLVLALGFAVLVLANSPVRANLRPLFEDGIADIELSALASSIILVMFAYSGWNAAAYIAEEIRQPQRNLPRSLILGTVLVIVLYLLLNLAYFSAVPLLELKGQIPVAQIAASAALSSGSSLLSLLVLLSISSSLTAMSIAGPRVYFAMSRSRLFPSWLGEVDGKRKLPLKAIWFQTGVALMMILVGDFRQILLFSGFVLLLFTTLTVSVLLRTRRDQVGQGSFLLPYRVLPLVFVATNLGVMASTAFSHTLEVLAGLLTLAAGLPVYAIYRHRLSGPPNSSRSG